jgi:hypothetical protein
MPSCMHALPQTQHPPQHTCLPSTYLLLQHYYAGWQAAQDPVAAGAAAVRAHWKQEGIDPIEFWHANRK